MINNSELIKLQRQAEANLAQGKTFEAIAIYEQIIKLKPDFAPAHSELGIVYEEQGWQDLALSHYCTALTLAPKTYSPESHFNVGNLLKTRGRIDEAIASYKRAIDINPLYVAAYKIWAKTLIETGNLEAAAAVYAEAESVDMELIRGKEYSDLGIAYVYKGNLPQAIATFEKAISMQPDYADAHCNLGNALLQHGQFREAILSFQEALTIDPNFMEVYYNLGRALVEIDKLDEAIACFEAAISLKPEFAEAHYNLGTALIKQNQLDAAIAAYDAAIRIQPNYTQAHWNRGHALRLQGELP